MTKYYSVKDLEDTLKEYDFKKSEERAIAWFIQTLINTDKGKEIKE